ncbi:GGDEF domain-containing protein [bacterium]|nr:GGDEF domain-containing protein [bacterium]
MQNRIAALRNLLAGELPLENVGPRLRQAVRQALRTGDEARLETTARVVVGELLRRGDLMRVAVEQDAGQGPVIGTLCLLKGTHRVVDLAPIGGVGDNFTLPDFVTRPAPRSAVGADHVADFTGMLGAMEDAQDLEIGDPQSGDKGTILAGILRLLAKFTPQFRLFVQLGEHDNLPEDTRRVFRPGDGPEPLWVAHRRAGQSVWIPVPGEFPAAVRDAAEHESPEAFPVACGVAVPLWEPGAEDGAGAGREAGVFFLVATDDWGRESLLRLAERLSRFVTRRWRHQREVNDRIHTDSLTGVANRAFFDTQFTLELERARRSEEPLTLIIADLDHFKRVNDELGHQMGDRTLQMVARRLQEELRRIDHICRIGGEEFALILPATGPEAGRDVVQRLLDAEFREVVTHGSESITLAATFSYGLVTFPDAGADAFELYRKADAMLYLSKDLGRNQCHIWNARGEHGRILPLKRT